jgi:hypothetical protein
MLSKIKVRLYKIPAIRESLYLKGYFRNGSRFTGDAEAFIRENKKYWTPAKPSGKKVLIEGFLSAYGPNYLVRTGMVAKAIEDKLGHEPVVVFNNYAYRSEEISELYRSFGINNFVYSKSGYLKNVFIRIKSLLAAIYFFITIRTGAQLLKFRFGNIYIGDLIYDEIIKKVHTEYTIEKIRTHHFKFIRSAIEYYYSFRDIFAKNDIEYLVNTHSIYSEYGVLSRLAMHHGAKIFETTDLYLVYHDEYIPGTTWSLPSYLHSINKWIRSQLKDISMEEKGQKIDDFLNKRLSGETKQVDVNLAYKDKKVYETEELKAQLGIKNNFPLVFIFCHVFSDAPHVSKKMIFRDYYDWLVETIEKVKNIDGVNWIVKPHPSAKLYGEEGIIANMVNKNRPDNLFLTPNDFSTASIKNLADVIVTCQGTVGLEFACFGIPVVLAGEAFYSNLGFTEEPADRESYFRQLENISTLKKLSPDQMDLAKKAFFLQEMIITSENKIISMDALKIIWGYGAERNVGMAYLSINEALQAHDPRDQLLYKRTLQYLTENAG